MNQEEVFKIAQIDGCCPYCLLAHHPTTDDQAMELASSLPEGIFPIPFNGDYLMACLKHNPGIPTKKSTKQKRSKNHS